MADGGVVWVVGGLSVCAVHVRMSGDACDGLVHELGVHGRLWVWVLVHMRGLLCRLNSPFFVELRRPRRSMLMEPAALLFADAGSWV